MNKYYTCIRFFSLLFDSKKSKARHKAANRSENEKMISSKSLAGQQVNVLELKEEDVAPQPLSETIPNSLK